MHTYSIDVPTRKIIVLIIFAISFLINGPINQLLSLMIASINNAHFNKLIDDIEGIGFSLSNISVLALFGGCYYLFSKHLWKWELLSKFLKVPNLNGEWIGTLESSHKNDKGENVKVGATLDIQQDWEKISIRSTFGSSHSYSDAAVIKTDSNKGVVLLFSYSNENENIKLSTKGDSGHRGLNELIIEKTTLRGQYFTNRNPPTKGNLFLMKSKEISEDVTPKQ